MAALTTTLALIGIAAAGAWAAKPGDKARTPGTSTRSRGDAPITGHAVPRSSLSGELVPLTAPQPPPSTTAAASAATASASVARDKARKRAAAGGSVLSGAYTGKTGPRAVLQPKMLIGS
jgi:hypothetical protein